MLGKQDGAFNMKMLRFFIYMFVATISLTSCMADNGIPERYYLIEVDDLPYGFIHLREALEGKDGIIQSMFWSTNIVFRASYKSTYDTTIFQTDVHDTDFIVRYQNKHYVNEKKILAIVDYAINISENLNLTYMIGDVVELRKIAGLGTVYNIKILSVENIGVDATSETRNVHEIKFEINPPVPARDLWSVFLLAETTGGLSTNIFRIIDEETVHVSIREGDRIDMLTVSYPFPGFSFRGHERKITVDVPLSN